MRPHNETSDDLRIENEARKFISTAWNCDIIKLSETLYSLDWCLYRNGEPTAWAEFKNRKQEYPDYLLSAAKYVRGLTLANTLVIPFLFFIGVGGRIIYADLTATRVCRVQIAGSSRGQSGDIEPCVFFESSAFKGV